MSQNGQVKRSGVLSEYRRRCVFKGDTPNLNVTKCFLKTAFLMVEREREREREREMYTYVYNYMLSGKCVSKYYQKS